jgi:acyl carrier protein
MREEIIHTVVSFIKTEIINDATTEIDADVPIIAAGLIDSMGIVRLMVHLQSVYQIDEFQYQDMILDNFKTAGKIADMIIRYRLKASAAAAPVEA